MSLIDQTPSVINIGLDGFNASVAGHGGTATQLEWQPPGDADPDLAWQLARLMGDKSDPGSPGSRIDAANREACERIIAARPMLVDVAPRADGIWPEMKAGRVLLHAGAPVAWGDMCGPMTSMAGIAVGPDGTIVFSADAEGSVVALRPAR